MPDGRVLIAGTGNPWAATPSWTRFDELANCRCSGWEVVSGRSNVFEHTDVGTATVHFEDRAHVLDTDSLVGRAIQLQIRNPVTGVWVPSWRGVIDEPTFEVYPLTQGLVSTVQLQCVDMFAWLARVEMIPWRFNDAGAVISQGHGHQPPVKSLVGSVWFAEQSVDDRIRTLLYATYNDLGAYGTSNGAGIPIEMIVVFSGNVLLWDTSYDPGESILVGCRDAADAEHPGVANIYVDRQGPGRLCFHGRLSRFTPESIGDPNWNFTEWQAGDANAIAASPSNTAQVRAISYTKPSSYIYNNAIAWPMFLLGTKPNTKRAFPEGKKGDQVYRDTASIADYGYRAMPPMGDLIVRARKPPSTNTGADECKLYAQYFVENYKNPNRVPVVTFKSMRPDDPRASVTWNLICHIDISDVLRLSVGAAGLSAAEYFVEGYRLTVSPLAPDYDYVELVPNLTPRARYATDPF